MFLYESNLSTFMVYTYHNSYTREDQIQLNVPDWETNSLYKLGRSVNTKLNILKIFGLSRNITDKNSGAQTLVSIGARRFSVTDWMR